MADFQPAVAVISALNDTIQKLKDAATSEDVNDDAKAAVWHQLEFLKHVQARADELAENVAGGKKRKGIGECGEGPCDLLRLAALDFRSDQLNDGLTDDQKGDTIRLAKRIDDVADSAVGLVKRLGG